MKPQKFKRFTVTDVAGLAAAYPGVVRHEPRADPFKVQKLLDCGVDLSQWVMGRDADVAPEAEKQAEAEGQDISGELPAPTEALVTLDCVGTDGGKASVEQVIPTFMNKGKKGE